MTSKNFNTTRVSNRHGWRLASAVVLLLLIAATTFAPSVAAQDTYSCFPSCDSRDGRMIRLGADRDASVQTDTLVVKLTSPANADAIEIGIFDGESAGRFDGGNQQLVFTLFADPTGRGDDFSTQLAQWTDAVMSDNDWASFTIKNCEAAQAPNGTYLYALQIHTVEALVGRGWNSFKVRTDGGLGLKCRQPFVAFVPMATTLDADVVYPAGTEHPETSTYDGTWSFYLNIPAAVSTLTIWDADFDNGGLAEHYQDLDTLSAFARPDHVWYEVVLPDGNRLENRAPSGSGEWKRFQLAEQTSQAAGADHQVDSLPAGIYQVLVHGMDLQNPNVFQFFGDEEMRAGAQVLGVNDHGRPVIPHGPYDVCGVIYYDDNNNGVQDLEEAGIPSVRLRLEGDYDGDGVADVLRRTTTDGNGRYAFTNLLPGAHVVTVDTATLAVEVAATSDGDGLATLNTLQLSTSAGSESMPRTAFGYDRRQASDAYQIKRRAYWARNSTRWPVTSVWVGNECLNQTEALTVMQQPTWGDMSYALAAELIAAKINVEIGNRTPCIDAITASADAWMRMYPVGSSVDPESQAWQQEGAQILEQLYDYNQSRPCPALVN